MESSPSTTPLTPPHHEDDWLDWLRLLRSHRVGPSTFYRLMGEHGTASAALAALPDVAAAAGVNDYEPAKLSAVRAEWKAGKKAGAVPLAIGARSYPKELTQIAHPPPFLWATGKVQLLSRPSIALIGARNASSLGTRMAKRLAKELGEAGFVVVSGLARGIDTASHLGAIETGTVAVMPGGLDVVYPRENAALAQEIAEKGVLLSERPMHFAPRAQDFPRRNRIISGASRAVVVVEAAAKSGSLITAKCALDQGREVMAVPGHPIDARAAGCNFLLRDGAHLVRSAEDIIEAIGPAAERADTQVSLNPITENPAIPKETKALHNAILERLGASPIAEDQLIRDTGLPVHIATREISRLELEGRVARAAGGLISRPG